MACASNAGVELLLAFRFLRSLALIVNIAPVVEPQLSARLSRYFALHVGPSVTLQDVPSALGEDHQGTVLADGRDRLDQPLLFQVSQVTPVRVERAILAVAEIAGGHDAEGADCGERANLRAAQPDVAVTCPDTLALWAARQIEIAREDIPRFEPLTFARIAQPATTAAVEFAIARVISPTRIESHIHLRVVRGKRERIARRRRTWPCNAVSDGALPASTLSCIT
jgi:hypothetical protein